MKIKPTIYPLGTDTETLKAVMDFEEAVSAVHRAYRREIENRLSSRVLAIEGQLPSYEEIAKFGRRVIYRDGRKEWYWKKALILKESATPFTFD